MGPFIYPTSLQASAAAKNDLKEQMKSSVEAENEKGKYHGDVLETPTLSTPPPSMTALEKALDTKLTPPPIGIQTVSRLLYVFSLVFSVHSCVAVSTFLFIYLYDMFTYRDFDIYIYIQYYIKQTPYDTLLYEYVLLWLGK